jgi:pimeloyl-ACP methyl ester carboxylesterase
MGDKSHLINKDITIDTFVADLTQLIEYEQLEEVLLVGHSFSGVTITGVADKIPKRLKHLVYLDSVVLESGKHSFSVYPQEEAERRVKAAEAATGGLAVPVPAQIPAAWGYKLGEPDYDWAVKRLTPHPLKTYITALNLANPVGNGVAKTYLECTAPVLPVLEASKKLVRSMSGWNWMTISAPHCAMVTHPKELAERLMAIAET